MIRFFLYFLISFTILSIPFKDRKLFYHLDKVAYPVTKHIIKKSQDITVSTLGDVKIWGIQLIEDNKSNKQGIDHVSSKSAAPSRNLIKVKKQISTQDNQLDRKSEVLGIEYYSKDELEKLQNMLKEAEY